MSNQLSLEKNKEFTSNPIIPDKAAFKRLYPILKWAGGKEQELKYILPKLPKEFNNYYEPFVGGGAVYTSIYAERYFINDKSEELISLYKCIKGPDKWNFFDAIEKIIRNWNLLSNVVADNVKFFNDTYKKFSTNIFTETEVKEKLVEFITNNSDRFTELFSPSFNIDTSNFIKELKVNLVRKVKRMKQLEERKYSLPDNEIIDNLETALKSAFYMHFRYIYNHTEKFNLDAASRSAVFFFIRNFAYSGMFRYNSMGHFNVPYGGIGYNRKNIQKKVDYLKSERLGELLNSTIIECLDFEEFCEKHSPASDDFMFLDPPYDSEFSTYAKNIFGKEDQIRLADYLINDCEAKWMLIIKNTDLIADLYFDKRLSIESFDKTYLVSFMDRNDKKAEHLLITNY